MEIYGIIIIMKVDKSSVWTRKDKLSQTHFIIYWKGGQEVPAYNKPVRAAITEEQYNKLMKYVKDNETTVSQVLRTAIKEYLENHKEEN